MADLAALPYLGLGLSAEFDSARRGLDALALRAADVAGAAVGPEDVGRVDGDTLRLDRVVVAADAGLPADFALLGKVSSGFQTVERIAELGDPSAGQTGTPRAPVLIDGITLE